MSASGVALLLTDSSSHFPKGLSKPEPPSPPPRPVAATSPMMAENTVRLRVVFDDHQMLSKSKKKEGLKRCWLLLKPQHITISDLSSHLFNSFSLHRTCPNGITLSMDGFVLPPFESTCILKDKDIICVKRKGTVVVDDKLAMLPSVPHEHQSIEILKLLAIEGFQEDDDDDDDDGGCKMVAEEDNSDQHEDAVYVEPKSDGNAKSKKRKSSKQLKSPSQKKRKLYSAYRLAVTPEVDGGEQSGSSHDRICHKSSRSKKDNDKSSNLSSRQNKSGNLDLDEQSNDRSDEHRSLHPPGSDSIEKTPSRSSRRKKAKRKWLREQLILEKEKQNSSTVLEKDGQQLPVKNNNSVVSNVHQQSDEEIAAEDDIVPVEIRPGHIRFEPLRKDQAARQNHFPVETFQWNGITSKKRGQKWGKEWTPSNKKDVFEHSSHESPPVHNSEKKKAFNSVDFDKLTPYTSLPKQGEVIAYRLIELSSSWTPELSSFRVGKISWYDAKSNRISLQPVLEYPFDFKKIMDEQASPAQFDPSPYEEDGSLEIDYASLVDVRVVNHGNSDSTTVVASSNALVNPTKETNGCIDEKFGGDKTVAGSSQPESGRHIPAKENKGANVWDEINEALAAKKAKLSQANGWHKEESSGTKSWSQRALRCSALGPTMAFLRSQKGL